MTQNLKSCPKCSDALNIRFEHVIKGTRFSRLYYCGSCHYEWDELQTVATTNPKAAAKPYAKRKPDRRRERRS
jgi:hypothetical protein